MPSAVSFTLDETKAILKHPSVHGAMHAIVRGRALAVAHESWPYDGKVIPTGPFRLFRASVEMAIRIGLDAAKDRDRERLLILLRLTEGDDPAATILAVGLMCEEYSVAMQYGQAGLTSWREFNHRT